MGEDTDDKMSLEDAIRYVAANLGNDWREPGRNLGLSDATLSQIRCDYFGNLREMCYQMLLTWKQNEGIGATVSVLADGLRKARRKDLADNIEGKRSGTFSSDTKAHIEVGKKYNKTPDVSRLDDSITSRNSTRCVVAWAVPIVIVVFASVWLVMFISDGIQRVNRVEVKELMDDALESDQLGPAIIYVKNSLTKEWQDVGRSLGLSHPELEHINEEYSNNPRERNYHMLRKWMEKYGKQATVETLSDALRKAGRYDLADNLPKGNEHTRYMMKAKDEWCKLIEDRRAGDQEILFHWCEDEGLDYYLKSAETEYSMTW